MGNLERKYNLRYSGWNYRGPIFRFYNSFVIRIVSIEF